MASVPVNGRVRQVDIARAVGVHVSVVSRVLTGDPSLNARPETRRRILDTAQELGYHANVPARALKTAVAGAVGVVLPTLRNPVWAEIARGMLSTAHTRGVAVLLAEVPDGVGDEAYARLVAEGRIDGLLLGNVEPPRAGRPPHPVPVVHVNRAVPGECNVTMDEAAAVRLAGERLHTLGHTRVAHLDGPLAIDTVQRRRAAWQAFARDRGLTLRLEHRPFSEDGGYAGMRRLLALPAARRPTAIGVAGLSQLLGALAALRESDLHVPGDVSLVTYDEDPFLDYLDVKVTSVKMPLFEMGSAAAGVLLDRIAGRPGESREIAGPMELVERASCGPVRP